VKKWPAKAGHEVALCASLRSVAAMGPVPGPSVRDVDRGAAAAVAIAVAGVAVRPRVGRVGVIVRTIMRAVGVGAVIRPPMGVAAAAIDAVAAVISVA